MSSDGGPRFPRLEDAILDEAYPDVDLALRRGRHIDRDDVLWYTFLVDAEDHLEPLYRRFGCELVHRTDGYFYLLPTGDALGKRHLSSGEMLVGQALTLLYLEPATLEQGGTVTREQVLGHLAGVVGADSLVRVMNPKRKKYDERVAQETVRNKVAEALRRLATLGFVEIIEEDRIRLRSALMRFAEPVRGAKAPEAALARLVAEGELVLAEGDDEEPDESDEDVPSEEAPDEDVPVEEETAEEAPVEAEEVPAQEAPAVPEDEAGGAPS